MQPSQIRDMLFELLKLVFLLKTLLKTGPPNLGIYIDYIHTDYNKTSMCDLIDHMYTD